MPGEENAPKRARTVHAAAAAAAENREGDGEVLVRATFKFLNHDAVTLRIPESATVRIAVNTALTRLAEPALLLEDLESQDESLNNSIAVIGRFQNVQLPLNEMTLKMIGDNFPGIDKAEVFDFAAVMLFGPNQHALKVTDVKEHLKSVIAAKHARLQASPDPAGAVTAASAAAPRGARVLIAASGSVATIKFAELAAAFHAHGCEVRAIATECARRFVPSMQQAWPSSVGAIAGDEDEWRDWKQVGDPVTHIELRRWADAYVIAPCSANTLAKLAHGLSDNLVTCVARAWDPRAKPLLVAPAMNTLMWEHGATSEHVAKLESWGIRIVPPVAKELACGDVGIGAMAAPLAVATSVLAALARRSSTR